MVTNKKIFLLLFIQLLITGLGGAIVGPLIPVVSDNFKVSLDIIGFAFSLNAFGVLAASLFSGIIAERLGKKNILIAGNILSILSFLGLYLSTNFIYFATCYIIFGISWGMIFVNSFSIISDVSQLNVSRAVVRLNIGFQLGSAFAPILVSSILFLNIGWRYLFLFVILINVILLISILSTKIESLANNKNGENFISLFTNNRRLLSNLIIILCGVISFLYFGAGNSFQTWFTTYFKSLNITLTVSSLLLSLHWVFIGLGGYIKSVSVMKFNEKKVMLFFSVLAFVFLFISFFTDWIVLKIIFILLFGSSIASIAEIAWSVSIKQDPRYSGPITSMMMSYAWMGVVIFQYTTGFLTENFSRESLIYICLVALFLAVVFVSILSFHYKPDKKAN
ncbi:MAG: MFS transporter [Actinobacteria bacterium]|nr:MFS transporter [Actinomycetota bacterium]